MAIGQRLKEIRESKKLSQGDIEKRSGLLRVYISRVENGHTVPSVATLEKMARALEIPLYKLFHEGQIFPSRPRFTARSQRNCGEILAPMRQNSNVCGTLSNEWMRKNARFY
jgi:transcriptional regulator with XRE-family HTH domain